MTQDEPLQKADYKAILKSMNKDGKELPPCLECEHMSTCSVTGYECLRFKNYLDSPMPNPDDPIPTRREHV